MIGPGIFARTFARDDVDGVLEAVERTGYRSLQFNMGCAGLSPIPETVPDGLPERIGTACAERSLRMEAVSATFNMAHPERATRRAGLQGLSRIASAASAMDTGLLTLCSGSRDEQDMWRWHPENVAQPAWAAMRESIDAALELTQDDGVRLAVEPERANVVNDAPRARRLIQEVGDPRLEIVLDWSNLVDPAYADAAGRILDEAVDLLGERLALVHVKDYGPYGHPVRLGDGALDLDAYLRALSREGFDGPLIIHGIDEADAITSRQVLEAALLAR